MHGDIKKPEKIVLKETDYINYEYEHLLMSAFIRSLLINHTFMFIGYSLNDYNLNLLIGWINYFSKVYGVDKRPSSFLVVTNPPSEFEKSRLNAKNIKVVDLNYTSEGYI